MKLITFLMVSQFNRFISPISANSFNSYNELVVENQFKRLVQDRSNIFIIDDDEIELEDYVHEVMSRVDNGGNLLFVFNPWRKLTEEEWKPKINFRKSTSYDWTFAGIISQKRTKARVEKYLSELLEVGHGREDNFILIGPDIFISAFLTSPVTGKFKNILVMSLNQNIIYQGQHQERSGSGETKFKSISDNMESVSWILENTAGLSGKHFHISGTKFPPYLDYVYRNGKLTVMGVNFRIFEEGSKRFNYTFEINDISQWKLTGMRLENGTWDGVYGDLLYGRTDIASVSTQIFDRNGLADFVGPFGRTQLIFITYPPEIHLGKYAIIKVYTAKVWGIFLGIFLIFLNLYYRALSFESWKAREKLTNGKFSFSSTFLLTLWALTFEQTLAKRPKGTRTRLLMVMWIAFMVVIGTGYKSNLAAFISFPKKSMKPRTFKELEEASHYKINFDQSGISAWNHFIESDNPMLQSLHKRSNLIENTTVCAVKAFMDKRTVCIGWDFTLKLATARSLTIPRLKNSLSESVESVWAAWYTFALAKNSIYTEAFQFIGQTCFERGLTIKWRDRLLNEYRQNGARRTQSQNGTDLFRKLVHLRRGSRHETKPLTIENFEFIFLILLVGLMISFTRFCYELLKAALPSWKRGFIRVEFRHEPYHLQVKTRFIP